MSALRDFYQLKILGHPMHPLLSHFPLVLIPAAVAFDIAAMSTPDGNSTLVQVAFYSQLAGIAMAALSAFFGMIDYTWELPLGSRVREIGRIHAVGMTIALVILIASTILRSTDLSATTPPMEAMAATIIATVILIPMGWLGGRMVFKYGTRVEVASHKGRVWAGHGDDDGPPNLPKNVKHFPSHRTGKGKKGNKK